MSPTKTTKVDFFFKCKTVYQTVRFDHSKKGIFLKDYNLSEIMEKPVHSVKTQKHTTTLAPVTWTTVTLLLLLNGIICATYRTHGTVTALISQREQLDCCTHC